MISIDVSSTLGNTCTNKPSFLLELEYGYTFNICTVTSPTISFLSSVSIWEYFPENFRIVNFCGVRMAPGTIV